jgi:hypothetical protein
MPPYKGPATPKPDAVSGRDIALEILKRAETERADAVNSPPHYTEGGIETIDFIEAKRLGYHLGNAVKYISRCQFKGDRKTDIEKAIWYLERYLETIKTEQ